MESLEKELWRMDNIALKILYQSELKSIMEQTAEHKQQNHFIQDYNDSRIVRSVLSQMIGPEAIPLRISLFTRQGDYIDFGWQPVSRNMVLEFYNQGIIDTIADRIDARDGGRLFVAPEDDLWYNRVSDPVISVYREFKDLYFHFGYIQIQEPFSLITELLESNLPGAAFVLKDENGDILYNTFPESHQSWINDVGYNEKIIKNRFKITRDPETGYKYYVMFASSEYSGWTLSLYQDAGIFLTPVRDLQLIYILLAMLLLIFGSMIIKILSRILTNPLKELHESIYQVNLQNLKITLEEKDSHQIVKQLNNGFQTMFQRLQDSVDEQLQSKESEARAHMTALQNQMNPHLLYNMLAHISNLAVEEDTGKIEEVCQRLSRSLRYLGRPDMNPVPLKEEISHLHDYLTLMKSHYDPLFDFSIVLDQDRLNTCLVPKLILQPIAENAFSHGYQNVPPPWSMKIRIGIRNNAFWTISFKDNGSGIPQEKRKELLLLKTESLSNIKERTLNHSLGGLALMNTITRMRLLYGDDMIFELESHMGDNLITLGGPFVQDLAR
ncbi:MULTISPECIES: sensor histidine kinase [unclassified Oceanispirochaeta]|uniref:sensor histidine kinase n=1 Tax=unclassified Oceanispirochaeta TaxID=2635722 RepID=UPI0013148F04|nr:MULTISPECIES: histidine kinase [unclassified Oceanispirochaeta]MBF9016546.1 histidine kinase [Oceanispirochaeta sp. M2]NPD73008.1 histidine kinase [Oceanispirochaeta sp. M1]